MELLTTVKFEQDEIHDIIDAINIALTQEDQNITPTQKSRYQQLLKGFINLSSEWKSELSSKKKNVNTKRI
ncbi:hypothetical protein [Piscibacillus salipiscarius]|uniref:hypothetical protein n=1 Tax=Piscibacillus salipiscarius TaxID=299480 RepID=UPI0006D06679|nr:hypothetical protein [Piscibacillus salipiscarius]